MFLILDNAMVDVRITYKTTDGDNNYLGVNITT